MLFLFLENFETNDSVIFLKDRYDTSSGFSSPKFNNSTHIVLKTGDRVVVASMISDTILHQPESNIQSIIQENIYIFYL